MSSAEQYGKEDTATGLASPRLAAPRSISQRLEAQRLTAPPTSPPLAHLASPRFSSCLLSPPSFPAPPHASPISLLPRRLLPGISAINKTTAASRIDLRRESMFWTCCAETVRSVHIASSPIPSRLTVFRPIAPHHTALHRVLSHPILLIAPRRLTTLFSPRLGRRHLTPVTQAFIVDLTGERRHPKRVRSHPATYHTMPSHTT